MLELRNPRIAIPVVLFAGLLWSFGPLVVRYMDNPQLAPWQYIFGRGLTIFILLNLYLFFEEGKNFYKNYYKIGLSGVIGGSGLGIAMITFIYSITNTSAAVTLLCLAAMPFFTALLAFLFLKEKISLNVWISIIIATVGIIIMALGNTGEKSLIGFVFGLTSSIGFSVFSVTLRWRKETPKFTTVATVVNFGVSFLHLRVTEKTEKPIEEVKPNTKPINDFSPVFPSAIIMIPTVAIIIDIQTLREIFSFKNKNANNAVKKGIAAKQSKVTAALVFVIE